MCVGGPWGPTLHRERRGMFMVNNGGRQRQEGTSLVEVLVTMLVVAIGLLGVAGLQAKSSVSEMESLQRSQAVVALVEMTERIGSNRAQAASYVTAGTIGTGD